jgi:hypothetical protein
LLTPAPRRQDYFFRPRSRYEHVWFAKMFAAHCASAAVLIIDGWFYYVEHALERDRKYRRMRERK